jgi:hypothetical protein
VRRRREAPEAEEHGAGHTCTPRQTDLAPAPILQTWILEGKNTELQAHLETLVLDELSRVGDARTGSFALPCAVAIVNVEAAVEPERVAPVEIVLPETALIMGAA